MADSKSTENDQTRGEAVLPPSAKKAQAQAARSKKVASPSAQAGNPRWLVPVMLGLMVAGLVYVVVAYLAQMRFPLPIGNYNLLVGFGLMIGGFALTTRWK